MREYAVKPAVPSPQNARGTGVLRRACACAGRCASCSKDENVLRRHGGAGASAAVAPPIVSDVLRAPGAPLDAATRRGMERRLGYDFGRVRVHADSEAAASAASVGAAAYTVGNHVAFGSGWYAPQTAGGKRLLRHELAHVMQARDAPLPAGPIAIGHHDDAAERDADAVADDAPTRPAADGIATLRRQDLPDLPRPPRVPPHPVEGEEGLDDLPDPAQPQAARARFADLTPDPQCPPPPTRLGLVPPDPPCPAPEAGPEIDGRHFEFCRDSDVLRNPSDRAMLIAYALSRPASARFRIHGFASAEGTDAYNLNLSCHRAKRVARELLGAGVPSPRISIAARGKTRQFDPVRLQPNRIAVVEAQAPAAQADPAQLPPDRHDVLGLAVAKIARGEYRMAADAYLAYWTCGMIPGFAEAIRRTTIVIEGDPGAPAIDHMIAGAELGRVVGAGMNTIVLSADTFTAQNTLECVIARIMDMSFHHMASEQIPADQIHQAALYAVELAGFAPCMGAAVQGIPGTAMWNAVTVDPRAGMPPPRCANAPVQGPMVSAAGRSLRPVPTFTLVTGSFRGNHGPTEFTLHRDSLDVGVPSGAMSARGTVQLAGDPATFGDYEIGYIQTLISEDRFLDYVSGHQIQQAPSLPMRDGMPTSFGGRAPWFDPRFVVRPNAQGLAEATLSDSPSFTVPRRYLDLARSTLPPGGLHERPRMVPGAAGDVLNRVHRHLVFHTWLVARRAGAPLDRFSTHFLDGSLVTLDHDADLTGSTVTGTYRVTPDVLNDSTEMRFTDPVPADVHSLRLQMSFTDPAPRASAAGALGLDAYRDRVRALADPIRRAVGLRAPVMVQVRIDTVTGRVALARGVETTATDSDRPVAQTLLDAFSQQLLEVARKDLVLAPISGRYESIERVPVSLLGLP
jgi:outer membrane protein OmpA-like peptidoglycan-associated protein